MALTSPSCGTCIQTDFHNQETWAKENKMKAPKMKWAKFKKWTKIEDIAEHERQPKYV